MPTYDYACDACKHGFEAFEPITAQPQKKCPKCKKKKLRRLFGAGAGLVFKGSGFYQTDYRSEGYKKSAAADKPATDAPASDSSSTKTEGSAKSDGSAKSEPQPAKASKPSKSDE